MTQATIRGELRRFHANQPHDNMNAAMLPTVSSTLHHPGRRRVAGSGAVIGAIALVLAGLSSAVSAQNVVRAVEYSYDPNTGLLILERVDPGGTHCVETSYGHDEYGNRKTIEVRPCASTISDARFTPRVTFNEFGSSADAQNAYPAGAYQTLTRSGSQTTPKMTEATATYDPRFGVATSQTEVATSLTNDTSKNITKRTAYDGFGRVWREYTPVGRNADGTLAETFVEYKYGYCPGTPTDPACLNLSGEQVTVNYASKRLANADGSIAAAASLSFRTAYYVEATPYSGSTVIGAISRVHYDALHREIAKESQAYDKSWVRTLTGYDQLGEVAATWTSHTGRTATGAVVGTLPYEQRQWTASRDLLHRPLEQVQYWRAKAGDEPVMLSAFATYNGLETQATTSPDGVVRTTYARKNAAGQTAQTVNADGATLNMAYDAVGNLVRTVDPLGNQTTVSYTTGTARFKTGMTDPDQGSWSYTYDALGQLKSQTDARNITVSMSYDELGRMTQKSAPTYVASWTYGSCAWGLNRVCTSRGGNNVQGVPPVSSEQFAYDNLGRLEGTTTTLDRAYTTTTGFDTLGRVDWVRYPTGFTVKYGYTGSADSSVIPGVLKQVFDNANTARKFWSIDPSDVTSSEVFDAQGKLLKAKLGNGVVMANRFDPISGKALLLNAAAGANVVLDQSYEYDQVNNLRVRKRNDGQTATTETFLYDVLDRLTQYALVSASDSTAAANRTIDVKYNALGNILQKGDVGGYTYTAGDKPHAVRSAGGTTYSYDANGNISGSTGVLSRTHVWNDFNHPQSMSLGSNKVEFLYDASLKRVKEVTTAGGTVRTLYLLHPDNAGGLGFEREVTTGSTARDESRHYISVGGTTIVVKTLNSAGMVSSEATMTNYWHKDSLGSVVSVTSATGAVVERMAFDAWGRRLRETGRLDPSLDPVNGNRGYTGHEHLDELGLIHMNGRVYDPFLARFLSPDPMLQSPGDLQNYNRYSYVLNNPLKYTDPNGELFWHVVAFVVGAMLAHNGNEYWSMAGSFMMMWGGQGLVDAGLGAASTNVVAEGMIAPTTVANTFNAGGLGNSMLSAAIATAATPGSDSNDILRAGLSAAAFTWAGGQPVGERIALHALIGCVQGAASNGQCGPSAMAAVVGKGVTEALPGETGKVARGIATVMAGGTASVIGGGKFANGAFQAGFGYLFNALAGRLIGQQVGAWGGGAACTGGGPLAAACALAGRWAGGAAGSAIEDWILSTDETGNQVPVPGTDKQFGDKFAEHRDPNKPGYRNHKEYRDLANKIYNDPEAQKTLYDQTAPKWRGETHILDKGGNLLRLDPTGNFRSLYPF